MNKVEVSLRKAGKGYALDIPHEARGLFPPNGSRHKNTFKIDGMNYNDSVWISKRHSPGHLDHIHVSRTTWWKQLNPKPKVGSKFVIEVTEVNGKKQYGIRLHSNTI